MINQRIQITQTGGPSVLDFIEDDIPPINDDEILIKHTAIGLNYIDTYHRTGLYPVDNLPFTPGLEGAGVVVELGKNIQNLSEGDRIAYGTGPVGSYSQYRTIPANKVVKLPDDISDEIAASIMLKGMTTEYLLNRTYQVKEGSIILFHAISGGVGSIACQWAKHLGAKVIGTAGSAEKAQKALDNGCDHVIRYDDEDFHEAVMDITKGQGVEVVYDSVGQATFMKSLDCLRPRGMMVTFGNASGPVDDFPPAILNQKGSIFLTRPSLMHYVSNHEELLLSSTAVFDVIRNGAVKIEIGQRYALKDARLAHEDLEARKTQGSTLLLP